MNVDELVIAAPLGAVPLPVAVFETTPASSSAWVMVHAPVQVIDWSGASVAGMAGVQVSGELAGNIGSVTVTPPMLTLPVFFVVIVG